MTKIIEKAGTDVRVDLGDTVRDAVTGFEGIVEAITVWRFGCRRVTVQPAKLDDSGKPIERQTFDEPTLHVIKRANIPQQVQERRLLSGGPKDDASERAALRRN